MNKDREKELLGTEGKICILLDQTYWDSVRDLSNPNQPHYDEMIARSCCGRCLIKSIPSEQIPTDNQETAQA